MSLWITYRDRDGRQKRTSITISISAILVSFVILITLLLPLVQWVRQLFS